MLQTKWRSIMHSKEELCKKIRSINAIGKLKKRTRLS